MTDLNGPRPERVVPSLPPAVKVEECGRGWQADVTREIGPTVWIGSQDVVCVDERCLATEGGDTYKKKISVTRYHWPSAAHGTMSTFSRESRNMFLTLKEAQELHRQLGLVIALDGTGKA